MSQNVRVWRIAAGSELKEVGQAKLDLESRLEDWLEGDIDILDRDLLVIGRQIQTDFGGVIDLLCIDVAGDLVILELKRDKTPREIVAQTLDYASWVDALSHDQVTAIANSYLGEASFEATFLKRFGEAVPDQLNNDHRMVVIASEIDASSERVITYLSDRHDVSINAATFQYFKESDGGELLTRVFLLQPDEVDYRARTKSSSKRKPNLTYEQLESIATERGVGPLYAYAVEAFRPFFEGTRTTQSNISFVAEIGGSRGAVLNLIPRDSDELSGLAFQVYASRVDERFGVTQDRLRECLPDGIQAWQYYPDAPPNWSGFAGALRSTVEVDALATGLAGDVS